MKPRFNIYFSLILAIIITLLGGAAIGDTPMSLSRVVWALLGQGSAGDHLVIWSIRVPRMVAAFLVGGALGMSGAALQGLLRNPLAEPGILGVSSVSVLFATLSLFFGWATLGPVILPGLAIIGALTATMFIALAARWIGSVVTLILIGIALSGFTGAMISLLMNMASHPFFLSDLMNWTLGSVTNRSFVDIFFLAPFILSGMILLHFSRRGLSALTLGDETASSLGLDLARQRISIIIGTGLATGGAVALAGAIGFVGIVAPHMVRPFVHHDPARTLWPSALLGGLMVMLADLLVRIIPTTNELKLGVVAALFGAPVFVWIAIRKVHS